VNVKDDKDDQDEENNDHDEEDQKRKSCNEASRSLIPTATADPCRKFDISGFSEV